MAIDQTDRIIGVDIAKIVSMLFVVAVHVNGYGLLYSGDDSPGIDYVLLRPFLDAIFMASINIFAMASGYVGIVSSFNLSRIIKLWIQVVFTGLVVLACLDFFTGINIQSMDYQKACIPIAQRQYWYMTAYFMLCFVMPILNFGLKAMDKKTLGGLILLLLGIICGESLMSIGALGVEGGYSFEWLLVLYVAGAYIRLYNPLEKAKWSLVGCACACAMVVGWMPLLLQSVYFKRGLGFSGYTSPFIVLIAVCIFSVSVRLRISSTRLTKFIRLLSSTSLGVYLIHAQPIFFREIFCREAYKLDVSTGVGYLFKLFIMTVLVYSYM